MALVYAKGGARPLLRGVRDVGRALVIHLFLKIYLLIAVYGYLSHQLFEWISPWHLVPVKNFFYWLVAATIFIFRQQVKEQGKSDVSLLKDSIGLTLIFEYFVALAESPLWLELITVPLVSFIVLMAAFTERMNEYEIVYRFFSKLQVFVGLILIGVVGYRLAVYPELYFDEKALRDFIYPLFMSIVFVPFVVCFRSVLGYQKFMRRLKFHIGDRPIPWNILLQAIITLRFRMKHLLRWLTWAQCLDVREDEELADLISQVKLAIRRERMRHTIPIQQGWSIRDARLLLKEQGLPVDEYNRLYDDVWSGSSRIKYFGDYLFSDHIDYHIYGNANVVGQICLRLSVNDYDDADDSIMQFQEISRLLVRNAFPEPTRIDLSLTCQCNEKKKTLEQGLEVEVECEKSSIKKNRWMNLKLIVQVPNFEKFPPSKE